MFEPATYVLISAVFFIALAMLAVESLIGSTSGENQARNTTRKPSLPLATRKLS